MTAASFEVRPIGHVQSSLTDLRSAPRQPDEGAPPADLVLDAGVADAVRGLSPGDRVVVVTWLDRARRDELLTHPRDDRSAPLRGVFGTRSADRPNPIGLHETTIVGIEGTRISVAGLEAVDGTPVLDIKPVLLEPGRR